MFVTVFPAKVVLTGKLARFTAIFPRQEGFGGFFSSSIQRFTPSKSFWRGISAHRSRFRSEQMMGKLNDMIVIVIIIS